MSDLLQRKGNDEPPGPPGTSALVVGGVRFAGTAAKFWPGLADEIEEAFPEADEVELSALCAGDLSPDQLNPTKAFERDLSRLLSANLENLWDEAVAELELLGPPAAVRLRVLTGQEERFATNLPLDCLDADLFPFLLVWLMQWGDVPLPLWNQEFVTAEFTGTDMERNREYKFFFCLHNEHLSEGLYRRTVCLSINSQATASGAESALA